MSKKNPIWPASQNPLSDTSNLVSSDVFAALCSNCSLVSFCNVGSMRTSWRTSFSRLAVMFLSLLWQSVMNPVFLHVRACSMLKLFPLHVFGVRDNGHPYLISKRSQNSELYWRISALCSTLNNLEQNKYVRSIFRSTQQTLGLKNSLLEHYYNPLYLRGTRVNRCLW